MVHHGSESFSLPDFYCTSYSNCPGAVRQTTDFTPGCAWLRLAALGCAWLRLAALGCAWLRLAALGCAWRCRCGGQRSTRRECGRVGILAQQRARLYIETKSIHQVSTSLNFSSSRKSRKSSYLEITMVDNLQMSKAHKKQSTVGS